MFVSGKAECVMTLGIAGPPSPPRLGCLPRANEYQGFASRGLAGASAECIIRKPPASLPASQPVDSDGPG